MVKITSYNVCFYCAADDGKTYYLGNIFGTTSKSNKLLSIDRDFLDTISTSCHKRLNSILNIPFTYRENTIKNIKFNERDKVNRVDIILWIGNNSPTCKVTSWKQVSPQKKSKRNIKPARECVLFSLNIDCLLYVNTQELFLVIINKYLEVCNEEQHKSLLNDGLFRFTVYQDRPETKPYCYVSIVPMNILIDTPILVNIYTNIIKNCPKEYIICEMGDTYSKHFMYIPKIIIKEKGKLAINNIKQVD